MQHSSHVQGHGTQLECDHRMKWHRNHLWSCTLGHAVHRKGPVLCVEREGHEAGEGRERGREGEREQAREREKEGETERENECYTVTSIQFY